MTSRITTKYTEFVLERHDIELLSVQELGGPFVLLNFLLMHLHANHRGVVVVTAFISHRHNGGVRGRAGGGDSLLQMGGKRRNTAATRQRVAKERNTARSCQ